MFLSTLESQFARSVGILIGFSIIFFALQGIILPQASYYGQIIFLGFDLLQVLQYIGLATGTFALISVYLKNRLTQRIAFATICWFYITFAFVLVWLIGLQTPSIVFSLIIALLSGAVYGYLTQREKENENINSRAYREDQLRKSVSRDNPGFRFNKR